MIWFNAASLIVIHLSVSTNDSKERCFGVTHNQIMNYVHVVKHLGSSREINSVVGDEVLWCETAMDMTSFFIANMVAHSISYNFKTYNTRNLWALKSNALSIMHPIWKMFGFGVVAIGVVAPSSRLVFCAARSLPLSATDLLILRILMLFELELVDGFLGEKRGVAVEWEFVESLFLCFC